jgi:hypothetical protein
MEEKDEWLANNRTWKKWTGLGEVGSLSYTGINIHKPKNEERLIKEIKRRKTLNDNKLEDNRREAAPKKEHRIFRMVETSGKQKEVERVD